MHVGVATFDSHGAFQFVSKPINGLGTPEDLVGQKPWAHVEDAEATLQKFTDCLIDGKSVRLETVLIPPGTDRRLRFVHEYHRLPDDSQNLVICIFFEPHEGEALTEREIEALELLADGKPSNDLARLMHLAESTVKKLLQSARAKLAAANTTSAAVTAVKHGLLCLMVGAG